MEEGTDAVVARVRSARAGDLETILDLQRRAFAPVAERAGNPNIPPMVQTLAELHEEYEHGTILVYECDGQVIGSVRASVSDAVAHVGRLIVDPARQRRGIGSLLMKELERRLAGCTAFELFTGEEFPELIRLYESLGYRVTGRTKEGSVPMVLMSKRNAVC